MFSYIFVIFPVPVPIIPSMCIGFALFPTFPGSVIMMVHLCMSSAYKHGL